MAAFESGGDATEIELAVLPQAQGRGIGRALLTAILRHRSEPRALLQTYDDDLPARRLSLREGFQRLVAATHGDVVLMKELR